MFLLKQAMVRESTEAAETFVDQEKRLEEAVVQKVMDLGRYARAVDKNWNRDVERCLAFIVETNKVREQLRIAEARARTGNKKPEKSWGPQDRRDVGPLRFECSSRFLKACWADLTGDAHGRERMLLITGPVTGGGVRVLSQMEHVKYAQQTPAFVQADPADLHRKLIALDEDGLLLMGMWHSHIMRGRDSSRPSDVDMKQQRLFIEGGIDTIGGIFTLDGYVRLYGTGRPLTVKVTGSNVEVVSEGSHETILKLKV